VPCAFEAKIKLTKNNETKAFFFLETEVLLIFPTFIYTQAMKGSPWW
jgi:hypothetical protein